MESREKKLYKNSIIIFISKIFTQLLTLILLPILTAKLTTTEYGTFDLITTYGLLLVAFLSVQVESAIFRFLIDYRSNEEMCKCIVTNGFISIIISFVLSTTIFFLFCFLFNIKNSIYIFIFSISQLILSINLQICRGIGNNKTYALASLYTGIINLILCFVLVYLLEYGLVGMVISSVMSSIIGGIYIFFKEKIYKYFSFDCFSNLFIIKMVKYSLPLVPNNITSWILSISDKIMISYMISPSANGIYSISTKFSILMSHIYSVFNLSWTESASISSNDNDREIFFSKSINNIFKICFSICLIMISLMPIFFKYMIDSNYAESYIYIPILIFASIFEIISGLLGAIYISLKDSKKVALTTVFASMVNIIINFIFIRKLGLYAACLSTLISYFILSIYRYYDIRKSLKIKFSFRNFILGTLFYFIISYFYYKNNIIISIICTLFTVIFSILFNRSFLISCFKMSKIKKINHLN